MGLVFPDKVDLEKYFQLLYDETFDRHFIKVNFENTFFTLAVTEIICGKNVSDEQMETLKIAIGTEIKIWRCE